MPPVGLETIEPIFTYSNYITSEEKTRLLNDLKASLKIILKGDNPPATIDNYSEETGEVESTASIDYTIIENLADRLAEKIDEYMTTRMQYESLGHLHHHHAKTLENLELSEGKIKPLSTAE